MGSGRMGYEFRSPYWDLNWCRGCKDWRRRDEFTDEVCAVCRTRRINRLEG